MFCEAIFLVLGLGLSNEDPIGREPTSVIRLECQLADKWALSYNHHSAVRDGIPFNDRKEHNVGVLTIERRFQLR